ncbi:uncharacterized protein NPIL_446221 [Nephila pilipes]|uniref:Uncharacterized protein n=1 Tax=Nephila pilipes TaxID=299642 RepID=A0A8X6Q6S0_NEPPI|nr:uncharacterized protein NPIL_690711 [Nephila pilipes]GFU08559.1 uncharacterized protein NPIL_446221 [Nephila pilipes]
MMMFLTFQRLSSWLLLVLCCQIPCIMAHFLIKDIAIAAILGGLLKPRFVPLPIPLPIPFTINKHVRKPYPVPVYTHSAEAYQVGGGQPFSHYSHDTLDDIEQLQQLSGSHALAQLESAADNIDSWVQQLSISSGGLEGSYSDSIPDIHDDLDEYSDGLADIHGIEDWW